MLRGHGGVDAAGVDLEPMELIGWELGHGAIGGGAELQNSLHAIVREEAGAEDLGEVASCVTAERVHLKEAIAGGDEALCEDEVIDRSGLDGGDAVGVACDGDGGAKARDGEAAVEPWERVVHDMAHPDPGADESGEEDCAEDEED